MTELQLPDVTWHDVVLSPDQPVTRGLDQHGAEVLEGRLSLGEPASVHLKSGDATDDRDLALFLPTEAASHVYYLVRLACTFRPQAGEFFAQAALSIRLARADNGPGPMPIAWSMTPRRAEDAVDISKAVKLAGKATLGGFVEISGGPEASKKVTRRQIELAALNEMQSNPTWELRKTEAADIDGSYLFALIVRSPADISARATLGLSASLQRARFAGKFFRYRAALPDVAPRAFML